MTEELSMARRSDEPARPARAATDANPESGTGGEDFTRAISGNIMESGRFTAGPVATPDRKALIAEAAYYRAERRGFEPGGELDDWLAAEREVEERSGEGAIG
jgi:hypothetical protein